MKGQPNKKKAGGGYATHLESSQWMAEWHRKMGAIIDDLEKRIKQAKFQIELMDKFLNPNRKDS